MLEMKNLVEELNRYRNAYYNDNRSLVSDKEYDTLFDRLRLLEDQTGIIYPNSPTQTVGYEVISKLKKVKHNHQLLSLGKTTDPGEFINYFGGKKIVLMAKMDGLTCSITYRNGRLVLAESRGNGDVGEDITHNALVISNLPKVIPFDGELIIDGECIIDAETFDAINKPLIEKAEKEAKEKGLEGKEFKDFVREHSYANPRNLASGTMRQLNSEIAAQRNVKFVAWKLHSAIGKDGLHHSGYTFHQSFDFLRALGFTIVPYYIEDPKNCYGFFGTIKDYCATVGWPIDGLVGSFDDITYGQILGSTSHHPKHSLAFKFYQEPNETTLLDIEWSVSRTGLVNPVAILDPVEIDGTTVSRASLSNVSIIRDLQLGIGDTVTLIKANQIIPMITSNLTKSDTYEIPTVCPCCGSHVIIKNDNGREMLYCINDQCHDRIVDKLVNFCGRAGMDIVGLSQETIDSLVTVGYVRDFKDIYDIRLFKDNLEQSSGFGKVRVAKLLESIEQSKNKKLENVIVAIGIPGIGKSSAKTIARHCEAKAVNGENLLELLIYYGMNNYDWTCLEDFGETTSAGINKYIQDHVYEIKPLCNVLNIEHDESAVLNNIFGGKSFCITGKLEVFANRGELVAEIEKYGGKIVSSVTAKTSYLITNDKDSGSSKNQKAMKYGTQILSEKDFIELCLT